MAKAAYVDHSFPPACLHPKSTVGQTGAANWLTRRKKANHLSFDPRYFCEIDIFETLFVPVEVCRQHLQKRFENYCKPSIELCSASNAVNGGYPLLSTYMLICSVLKCFWCSKRVPFLWFCPLIQYLLIPNTWPAMLNCLCERCATNMAGHIHRHHNEIYLVLTVKTGNSTIINWGKKSCGD